VHLSSADALEAQESSHEMATAERLDVLAAIRQLPPRQRAVIVLRFYSDASVQETADALGCSVGTVKSQTADGLRNLRRLLDSHVNTEGIQT
jgi:RNA polymerase sigma factor (sigma-70 family)